MSDIIPETAERLGDMVKEFTGSSGPCYRKIFAYMMQAPAYRFALNAAAALLGLSGSVQEVCGPGSWAF